MTLLSICIPTYNRSGYLDQILASLSGQLSGPVELVILDNASTDDTAAVVARWREKTPDFISYERHPETILGNANLMEAARRGTGRYTWVLGDDEIVPPGALAKIMRWLEGGYDYVILNHAIYDRFMKEVKMPACYELSRDAHLRGRDAAAAFLGTTTGFISAVVAKRGVLTSLDDAEFKTYAPYGFNQLYAFYKGLPVDARGVVTAELLIQARGDNAGAYDWNKFFVTGVGLIFHDLRLRCGYGGGAVRRALGKTIRRYHAGRAKELRRDGKSAMELLKLGYPYFSGCWEYWLVLAPLVLAPSWAIRLIGGAKRRVKRWVSGGGAAPESI